MLGYDHGGPAGGQGVTETGYGKGPGVFVSARIETIRSIPWRHEGRLGRTRTGGLVSARTFQIHYVYKYDTEVFGDDYGGPVGS